MDFVYQQFPLKSTGSHLQGGLILWAEDGQVVLLVAEAVGRALRVEYRQQAVELAGAVGGAHDVGVRHLVDLQSDFF